MSGNAGGLEMAGRGLRCSTRAVTLDNGARWLGLLFTPERFTLPMQGGGVRFRAEPLPGFGGATPDLLVRAGRADQVHAYLDRIMAGGYA